MRIIAVSRKEQEQNNAKKCNIYIYIYYILLYEEIEMLVVFWVQSAIALPSVYVMDINDILL